MGEGYQLVREVTLVDNNTSQEFIVRRSWVVWFRWCLFAFCRRKPSVVQSHVNLTLVELRPFYSGDGCINDDGSPTCMAAIDFSLNWKCVWKEEMFGIASMLSWGIGLGRCQFWKCWSFVSKHTSSVYLYLMVQVCVCDCYQRRPKLIILWCTYTSLVLDQ